MNKKSGTSMDAADKLVKNICRKPRRSTCRAKQSNLAVRVAQSHILQYLSVKYGQKLWVAETKSENHFLSVS